MKYTDEEILSYARSQIRFVEQQKGKRLVLGFMGLGTVVIVIWLFQMVTEKSEKMGINLLQEEIFLAGIAMGVLFFLGIGAMTLCTIRMFSRLYGKEIEVCKLLVRLADGRS